MTFDDRTSGKRGDLAIFIVIQGIDTIFCERDDIVAPIILTSPIGSDAWEKTLSCIESGSISVGEQKLDRQTRIVTGGSLEFSLCEERGSTAIFDIFQPRKRRSTYLTENITRTFTAGLDVADNTWAPSSGTLYIGGETISYDSKSGTEAFVDLTRGRYFSEADPHFASTSQSSSSSVFSVPPTMHGRRVFLYGAFVDDNGVFDSGNTAAALAKRKLLGVYTIDSPPEVEDGIRWKFSCSSLMSQIINEKAYVGFSDASPTGLFEAIDDIGEYKVYVDNAACFAPPGGAGSPYTHAIVSMTYSDDEYFMLGSITGIYTASSPNYVVIKEIPGAFGLTAEAFIGESIKSIRHIYAFAPSSGYSILSILTSRNGDNDNGSFDELPGTDRASGNSAAWRMGCGIDSSIIDTDSFQNVGNNPVPWFYVLDETATAGSILTEWCIVNDAFCVVEDGKLTAKKILDIVDPSVVTVSESNISSLSSLNIRFDESEILPIVKLACNYSPADKNFHLKTSFVDHELKERYPQNGDDLSLEFKGLDSGYPTSYSSHAMFRRPAGYSNTFATLEGLGRSWQRNTSRGNLIISAKCTIDCFPLSVGDAVSIDLPDVPSLDGGYLQGVTARVVGARHDFNEFSVTLEMALMEKVFLITPSDVATAVSTTAIANDTLTFATSDSDYNYDAGMSIRLWDVSAGTSQVLTVLAFPSATTIQFTTGITGTVQTGVDWFTWNTNGTNSASTPASGFVETDYSFLMPADLSVSTGAVRRWR